MDRYNKQIKKRGEQVDIDLQGLWKKYIQVTVVVMVVLILSGCSQLGLIGALFNQGSNEESHTLVRDDFSDKDSGWGQFIYPEGAAVYKNDTYQIIVNVPNSDIFITYPRVYINSMVQADINKVSGSNDNNYGLICRFKDAQNFYAGQISSDGFAGIIKVKNGVYELIGREQMAPVPAILGGEAVNQVRFECVQDTLTLIVNEQVVDVQTDDTFISGEVGLIAGTVSGYEGVFAFDNFIADVR